MAAKDIGAIESDYAFFMAHATEAEQDAADYARELAGFADQRARIRMLDFGCGAGDFTARLLRVLGWPSDRLELTLVEPVAHQRQLAAQQVSEYCATAVQALSCLPDASASADSSFDLIVSNHVLYYVDDLSSTLSALHRLLAPRGRLLLAIAGWNNMLLKLWQAGFALLGTPVPYYSAEDVAGELSLQEVPFRRTDSHYELRFADTTENRRRILRFLFADYLARLPEAPLLAEFDRYAQAGQIVVRTQSDHFVIDGT